MNDTKKLTAKIPVSLNSKLASYCKRKGLTMEKATEKAITNMLSADNYMLEVARTASKINTA